MVIEFNIYLTFEFCAFFVQYNLYTWENKSYLKDYTLF